MEEYLLRAILGTYNMIFHKVSTFCGTGATNFNVDVHCHCDTDCYLIENFISSGAVNWGEMLTCGQDGIELVMFVSHFVAIPQHAKIGTICIIIGHAKYYMGIMS